ncbi:MAG: hypothetical protein DI628_08050 [Blastochloris viridis]|uniref:Uncharacterized protein n=1 Tax=Blastochloris viridis TaxID=1079 RepID=A0A6N4RC55_BLAVI|nr:MAG: hypothetical protein DI628_08050 [Blastochloris viridis]
MNPTQKHMTFMKSLINARVLGSMADLMTACPDPEQLPNLEESLRFVKCCHEHGRPVRVTDVVHGLCETCH